MEKVLIDQKIIEDTLKNKEKYIEEILNENKQYFNKIKDNESNIKEFQEIIEQKTKD